MNHVIDSFLSLWWYWMFVSFGLGVVGFGFLFYVQYGKPTNKRQPLITGGLLFAQVFVTWIIAFGLAAILESNVRSELKQFMNKSDIEVWMDNDPLSTEQSQAIITELRKVDSFTAHHSSPTDNITIELISNSGTYKLRLSRDSEIPTEYWIFTDKYKATTLNEIGRIQTEIFN